MYAVLNAFQHRAHVFCSLKVRIVPLEPSVKPLRQRETRALDRV